MMKFLRDVREMSDLMRSDPEHSRLDEGFKSNLRAVERETILTELIACFCLSLVFPYGALSGALLGIIVCLLI